MKVKRWADCQSFKKISFEATIKLGLSQCFLVLHVYPEGQHKDDPNVVMEHRLHHISRYHDHNATLIHQGAHACFAVAQYKK